MNTYKSKKKKVYIGLSGGVDSAVSALLLLEAGYDVTGVYIKSWQPDYIECTWKRDRQDAMRVCAQLGIKFITLDLEKEYKQNVIDYMISEYRSGRTPNPDIMCNRFIKFGGFWSFAKQNNVDFIATGHYAKIDNNFQLVQPVDTNKDQTYFLYKLNRDDLSHVLFPLANLKKEEVRILAQKHNLWVSEKKDSQGICMLGDLSMKDFLKKEVNLEKGKVISDTGEVVGEHDGAALYTIGERHGFRMYNEKSNSLAVYIYKKDIEKNVIYVKEFDLSDKEDHKIDNKVIKIDNLSWCNEAPVVGGIYKGRGRYRAPLATLKCLGQNEYQIVDGEILNVPGQSLVIYDVDICLGGGIII